MFYSIMSLKKLAHECGDVLKPFGETDVLLFYGIVAQKLRKFLRGKEIATKTWLPSSRMPFFIRRGSKQKPLYIDELADNVTPEFLEVRNRIRHLKDAKKEISGVQARIWDYFVPRKLVEFFYATNNEGRGKGIDRVFFDIDRGKGASSEHAKEVTAAFVGAIAADKTIKTKPFVSWTGNSFHVYIMLPSRKPNSYYEKNFKYSKNAPLESLTGKWAAEVAKKTRIKVMGGHEKAAGVINIDPSQTPSGKLCRIPLGGLHMADARSVDGVSIPVENKMLKEPETIKRLQFYSPKEVVNELDVLAKRLPA